MDQFIYENIDNYELYNKGGLSDSVFKSVKDIKGRSSRNYSI